MTEQMAHVSCLRRSGVALRMARRKCVGSWETLCPVDVLEVEGFF